MADMLSPSDLEEVQRHYWQIARFRELGYSRWEAERLELAGVDWHEAQKLLEAGARPHSRSKSSRRERTP